MKKVERFLNLAAISIAITGIAAAQSKYQHKTLVINGHSGDVTVFQIDGRSYADLETIVRIANGSLSFKGDTIILSLTENAAQHHAADRGAKGMSTEFIKAALQDVSLIKEWSSTLAHAIQRGVPGDGSRIVSFHDRAADQLRLAKMAAANDEDQSALRLLTNHFNLVNSWSDKLVAERKAMDTGKYSMNPNALANDETYQKITGCSKFLGTMLPSGHFQNDRACN